MHSTIKFNGSTPGTDSNTYVLLATILPAAPTNAQNMNVGECYAAIAGIRKLALVLKHSHLGTLNLYESIDRGANWSQIDTIAVATPASTTADVYDFLVEGLRDFKLEWVNGGTAQTTWHPLLSLGDQRASAL